LVFKSNLIALHKNTPCSAIVIIDWLLLNMQQAVFQQYSGREQVN
jgi:hypothetical protein